MKNLGHIKGIDQLPKTLTEDWIEQAIEKVDKSQMTFDQRMHYEMMLAKNASIIKMLKEEERQKIVKETTKKIAKKLKQMEVNYEIISESTNLTMVEIESL